MDPFEEDHLGDHSLVSMDVGNDLLALLFPGADIVHETGEVLLTTQARQVRAAVPCIEELCQIRLGQPASGWNNHGLEVPVLGRRGSFAGQHRGVAAGGPLIEPTTHAIRTVDPVGYL